MLDHVKRPVRPVWLAKELKVSTALIYGAIKRNQIEAIRLGKSLFIPWREAQRLLGAPAAAEWVDWKQRQVGSE